MGAYPVNLGSGTGMCGVTVVLPCLFVFVMLVLWSTFGSCMINMDGLCVVRNMVSSLTRVVLLSPRTLYEMIVNRVSLFIYLSFPFSERGVDVVRVIDVFGVVLSSVSLPFLCLFPVTVVFVAATGCVTDVKALNAASASMSVSVSRGCVCVDVVLSGAK